VARPWSCAATKRREAVGVLELERRRPSAAFDAHDADVATALALWGSMVKGC